MKTYKIDLPLTEEKIMELRCGDKVYLNGILYTARDSAHKRLVNSLKKGDASPFTLKGSIIYYVGPTPAPPGRPIGSAGPTSSYRMDTYAPFLYSLGVKATIGKGKRTFQVRDSLKKYKCIYLGATGGVGALLSLCIKKAEIVAYEDLGPEAIFRLEVKDFPTIVIADAYGDSLYEWKNE